MVLVQLCRNGKGKSHPRKKKKRKKEKRFVRLNIHAGQKKKKDVASFSSGELNCKDI